MAQLQSLGLDTFNTEGFLLVPAIIPPHECAAIADLVPLGPESVGSRCLLPQAWCAALARRLQEQAALAPLIPAGHVAVQCTSFEKSSTRNWLVPVHQDLSIPVATRVDELSLKGWSTKEGALYVQAPIELLEQLVAVRLHLDACTEADGPLRVVPGTHLRGRITPNEAILARSRGERSCPSAQGGALAMRPLLLHASSKSTGSSRRRVLHFVYGPRVLKFGLRWQHAV